MTNYNLLTYKNMLDILCKVRAGDIFHLGYYNMSLIKEIQHILKHRGYSCSFYDDNCECIVFDLKNDG